jgi:site-specific DNA-methyltransferase (adenine-specific)
MDTPDSIPITSILVDDRQRIDHTDTDGLEVSLKKYGTIQPIVLEALSTPNNGYSYRLIAGGRRLTFLKVLGHTELYHGSVYNPARPGYVFGTELTPDELAELELEENLRRKDMTWQEKVRGIAKIHRLKTAQGIGGRAWTQRLTGELFGVSAASINQALALEAELRKANSPTWGMLTANDAHRYLLAQQEQVLQAELVRRHAEQSATLVADDTTTPGGAYWLDDVTDQDATILSEKEAARDQYLSNPHNDPNTFDSYWEEKLKLRSEPIKMYLSPRMYKGDCLTYMRDCAGRFDHIITDPPYGIDVNNMDQTNHGMANIDSIRGTHDVEENLGLLREFVPLAYSCIKDRGFLCMWADYAHWEKLRDLGIQCGFRVQRWPVIWVKTHQCQNTMAYHNFTKTTEIAIIMSKGGATLATTGPLGHILASHDEYKEMMDHPFVKPFAAWEHLIRAVSLEGQTIYDPFSGEGSGPLSFIRLNRQFFCSELDEVHFNKQVLHLRNHYLKLNPNTVFV